MAAGFADLLVLQGVWLGGRKKKSSSSNGGGAGGGGRVRGGGPEPANPWAKLPRERREDLEEELLIDLLEELEGF